MKKLIAICMLLGAALGGAAQSPTYRLKGADKADPEAVALLREHLAVEPKGNVEIIVGEAGDKAVKRYAREIPATAEGFFLSVEPKRVVIAGRDGTGTFYGVQEFLKNPGRTGVVKDAPAMAFRGVIEGFYGNPWSDADRRSQFDFYGKNRMNIYIYGPKDDPYHHSKWYEPYPAAEAAQMSALVDHARRNKVEFIWAMHPSNAIETDADKAAALEKFRQMYDLGVRRFAIFFDDISARSVDAQIAYLNFLDDNFVKTHPGVGTLIVCPTQYNRAWSGGDYLPKMGAGLHPEIDIMWTGNSVCDMIDAEDCEWFTSQTGRKPFIWLNYPVNDYGMHNLLMGPVVGNDPAIADKVAAFCSNPMQYAEASKVALYSLADFAWAPEAFNADSVWEASLTALEPAHREAFRRFCLNNVDVGQSVHGLRMWGETPEFKALSEKYPTLSDPDAVEAYREYFRADLRAAAELIEAAKAGDPLLKEVFEWLLALKEQAEMGLALTDMAAALDADLTKPYIDAYRRYAGALDASKALVSRGFPGSIQSVRVQTGTLYVAPWLKRTAAELVNAFKASGAEYPADLFPVQLIEDGTYYIKNAGRWLGNPQGAGNPVWQSQIDDINPNRQEWHIKLNPETERYEIRNAKDERYVNEIGNFGVNPYSADWNTYLISKGADGRYSIQNAGNGGSSFWHAGENRIDFGGDESFDFEIIPVNQ